ncbi:MAG: hypothetical protein ACYDEO_07210 [Aggregatilineales bacterium]
MQWGELRVAIYRDSPSIWRSWLPWIVGGIIVVVLVIGIGLVLLNSRNNQARSDNGQASVSAALDTIAQSLDVFDVEYAKTVKGTPANQTGAPGAIRTALDTLDVTQTKLIALDAQAFAMLQANLNLLNAALSVPAPVDMTAALNNAKTQLQTLRTRLTDPSNTPTPSGKE